MQRLEIIACLGVFLRERKTVSISFFIKTLAHCNLRSAGGNIPAAKLGEINAGAVFKR